MPLWREVLFYSMQASQNGALSERCHRCCYRGQPFSDRETRSESRDDQSSAAERCKSMSFCFNLLHMPCYTILSRAPALEAIVCSRMALPGCDIDGGG